MTAKIKRALGGPSDALRFFCPGCKESHVIYTSGPVKWEWNGSFDSPTSSPSILVHRHAMPDAEEEFEEYRKEMRCHSFVRNGQIEFLSDCTHSLAGQIASLPEIK